MESDVVLLTTSANPCQVLGSSVASRKREAAKVARKLKVAMSEKKMEWTSELITKELMVTKDKIPRSRGEGKVDKDEGEEESRQEQWDGKNSE